MDYSLAIIIACHNRKQTTLLCLEKVFANDASNIRISTYLLDDGSMDGTSEAVKERFPTVNILKGNGDLFWTRGMHKAFGEALKEDHDYYLWLNDDTLLYPDSIPRLINCHLELVGRNQAESILVGSTCDPVSGELTYGGYRSNNRLHQLRFHMLTPTEELQECDTMCGNCVLIPKEAVNKSGNIDPIYQHRWGDMDYGLRAKKVGCKIFIAPGYIGTCEDNPLAKSWRDYTIPLIERIRILHSIKGLHKRDWKTYVKRHGGKLWIMKWLKPYLIILISSLLRKDLRLNRQ
jgi:GT2 family glycosyltransferase